MIRLGYVLAVAMALATAPLPVWAQAVDSAAVALTEADVPGGLRLSRDRSGQQTRDGITAYGVTFEADPSQLTPGSGGIIAITNLVASPADPAVGLAEMSRSARQSAPGPVTDLAPPDVGDESRAFSGTAGLGPISVAMAATFFRRESAVVGLMVIGTGDQPPMEECLRLARLVDARVVAAGPGGAQPAAGNR